MIEFTLPLSAICANMLCLMMLVCLAGIGWSIASIVSKQKRGYEEGTIAWCLMMFFIFDAMAMIASYGYSTTPIEGTGNCIDGYVNMEHSPCHYHPESENPFANQPIHPIHWTSSIIMFVYNFMHGAVNVKVT